MNANEFDRHRQRNEAWSRSKRWRKRAMQHLVADAGAHVIASGSRIIAYKLPDGTTACFKRRFPTEDAANRTLRQIACEPEPRKKPIRAYPCFECSGWHVTSKAKT
jgi:hypothetical protein